MELDKIQNMPQTDSKLEALGVSLFSANRAGSSDRCMSALASFCWIDNWRNGQLLKIRPKGKPVNRAICHFMEYVDSWSVT
jgi:hypothetical protein